MSKKTVTDIRHVQARRKNIPTVEDRATMLPEHRQAFRVAYERGDRDLDPQLVWRGKYPQDQQEWQVAAPPLYIQEKIHPKVVVDDLQRETRERHETDIDRMPDLFADFNGLPADAERTDFYRHDLNWSNRMILGDSLQVMASLAEREALRGKVQCIFVDPPHGINFKSNFQWSVNQPRPGSDSAKTITREPEQVRAFRDTWRHGVHSYLTYLRDRLVVARDLLADSGSMFVQIGAENVHRVRAVMDEVFGEANFVSQIWFLKTTSSTTKLLATTGDYLLWYGKCVEVMTYRKLWRRKDPGKEGATAYKKAESFWQLRDSTFDLLLQGDRFTLRKGSWKTNREGFRRLKAASRVVAAGRTPRYVRCLDDHDNFAYTHNWTDTGIAGFTSNRRYVVETLPKVVERCILMTTDPGDLVLDPTCGAGTTAYVAEQWGRRWITIDTSRVALALARMRVMGAHYPYYVLAGSREGGAVPEARTDEQSPAVIPALPSVRHGFVYERALHIKLKTIANNAEIDVVYDTHQPGVASALEDLNRSLCGHSEKFRVGTGGRKGSCIDFCAPDGQTAHLPSGELAPQNGFMEWEVPSKPGTPWPLEQIRWHSAALRHRGVAGKRALARLNLARKESWESATALPDEPVTPWPADAEDALRTFWEALHARQEAIDRVIASAAEYEELYDRPEEDDSIVRVAGPFTVESVAPHRTIAVGGEEAGVDRVAEARRMYATDHRGFVDVILANLRRAGVQQAEKEGHIRFSSVTPWPGGGLVCAEGLQVPVEKKVARRYAIFVGPEFGTVSRPDLVEAAREAAEMGAYALLACAFNYDASASELARVGRLSVLKARMNADLHMATDLRATNSGNLFVVFGEPDVALERVEAGLGERFRVRLRGVDVYDPTSGQVRSSDGKEIACWFVDTNYDAESFRVRHAYFLGTQDHYGDLAAALKAEIDEEAWASLRRSVSRPFGRPQSGRIAVKVINHLGDEVMKVIRV